MISSQNNVQKYCTKGHEQVCCNRIPLFGNFEIVDKFEYYFFLGAVHKLRLQEEGGRWSKKLTFCKLLHHGKCKRRGVGGQKKPNFVNVVCE